jgi:hypothetical protein
MKQVFMMALLVMIAFAACEKSELLPPKVEARQSITGGAKVWIPVGAFDTLNISNRNGYYPFHSPYAMMDYDIFNPTKLYINNLLKLDTVFYNRVNNDRNVYLGVLFNPFKIRYKYSNGRDTTFVRLAPAYIADTEIRVPIPAYNQLHSGNPEYWTTIERTHRRVKVLSPYCGKDVWKWTYHIITSGWKAVNEELDSNCSNQLQYNMIF